MLNSCFSRKHNKNIGRCRLPELKVSVAKVKGLRKSNKRQDDICLQRLYYGISSSFLKKKITAFQMLPFSAASSIKVTVVYTCV